MDPFIMRAPSKHWQGVELSFFFFLSLSLIQTLSSVLARSVLGVG